VSVAYRRSRECLGAARSRVRPSVTTLAAVAQSGLVGAGRLVLAGGLVYPQVLLDFAEAYGAPEGAEGATFCQ